MQPLLKSNCHKLKVSRVSMFKVDGCISINSFYGVLRDVYNALLNYNQVWSTSNRTDILDLLDKNYVRSFRSSQSTDIYLDTLESFIGYVYLLILELHREKYRDQEFLAELYVGFFERLSWFVSRQRLLIKECE